jgi:hypothetical protein
VSPPDDDDPTKGADHADHADRAWLSARERGEEPLPPIDPQRAAAYRGLQKLIASLPDDPVPEGWNDDVLAAVRAGEQPAPIDAPKLATPAPATASEPIALAEGRADRRADRRTDRRPARRTDRRPDRAEPASRGRNWQLAGALALAAAAALAIWMAPRNPPTSPPGLQLSVLHYEGMRADVVEGEAALGDVLVVEASTSDIDELRIYRDDRELVLRCPAAEGAAGAAATCERKPGVIVGRLRLTAPGRYRAVGLRPAPTSPSSGDLAADLAACRCQPRTTTPVVAR